MRALKRLVALAASLVMMAGLIGPATAADVNLTLTTTDVGTFTWNLWGSSGLALPDQSVDYDSGGTVRTGTIIEFTDTQARSEGWSLNIKADNLVNTANSAFYVANSNIRLIANYNNLSHGPGHCFQSGFMAANPDNVPGNPYQTITFPQTYFASPGVTLGTEQLMASGSAGRGCGGKFQNSFHIDVTVPGGTPGGTYKTKLVVTEGNAP